MLLLLHIENIAVIEEADIRFEPGFNALTGETGAGKSIVIDAMGAVLGRRTSRDLIRTGAERAFVSAQFSDVAPALPQSVGAEAGEDGSLVLQRELGADGKNLCRVNGRPVTVAQLRELGSHLLDIHGQHDGQQLLDETQHRAYLDRYGRTEDVLAAYRVVFERLTALRRQIRALVMDESEKERRMDTLRFQIAELERAELEPGEEESLRQRREILRSGEKFTGAIDGAELALRGGDEDGGAVSALRDAVEALGGLLRFGEPFQTLSGRLESLRCEAEDVAETLRELRRDYDFSPEELDSVETRCDQLYRLKKKYGATVEDMIGYLDRCRRELDEIEFADDTLLRLREEEAAAVKDAAAAAERLTAARKAAAAELEQRIQTELRQLDMPKVRFSVDFSVQEPDESGADAVCFLMSANVGEALKPIDRIASGGELARIMLAMKNVLAETDEVGTLVFDEVDTGVSGRAAQRVAEKLAQVSRGKQVLCVTHLPQIAAMADTHFTVEKGERKERTFTEILLLDLEQRKRELARITGGERITEALLQSAGELLDGADAYRRSLR